MNLITQTTMILKKLFKQGTAAGYQESSRPSLYWIYIRFQHHVHLFWSLLEEVTA
jgi:hypothetical protein